MKKVLSIQEGLQHLKNNWKSDLISGFSVSLIALPLCLGIALASGFPPIAGIFAAIVGGLLVSRVNGSNLTIAGPAAGLIVVNLAAIESLGGAWSEGNPGGLAYALAAIFIAGLIIIVLGLFKVGKFGDFFPGAAVHGMLAAIGIIIIIKQLFPALGAKAKGKELYEVVMQIPEGIRNLNSHVAIIAGISLLILILHARLSFKWLKKIPAPLIVLLVTVPLAQVFKLDVKTLVDLPKHLSKSLVMPDFSKMAESAFWIAVMTIALVTAIESILSAIAVDQLDPLKRKSNLGQDLIGLGSGAALSGFIGGLPMISEIVRSSANIGYGAKSQWSNFFHGLFLLVFILLLRPLIEMIPLSALAGMLIFTGFRLASPKEFRHMWQTGFSEFIVFLVTCLTVLAIDLLVGIGIGILLNMIIVVMKGQSLGNLFKLRATVKSETELLISDSLSFTNYLGLKKRIMAASGQEEFVLDFRQTQFIDHNAMHHLLEVQMEWKRAKRNLVFRNLEELQPINENPTAERHRGGEMKIEISQRDKDLAALAERLNLRYNHGSIYGEEFRNFKLLSNLTVEKAHNILENEFYIVGDVVATERMNLDGGGVEFTAFSADRKAIPKFRMGTMSFFDKIQDLITGQIIKFEEFPEFSSYYLVTSDEEEATRKLFTPDLLTLLEVVRKFKIEVNEDHILIFGTQKLKSVEEIEELILFGRKMITRFYENTKD